MHFNLLDYIIIAILLLSALNGLRQGFIDALGGMLSTVLALVVAVLYFEDCALYLEQNMGISTFLTTFIKQKVPVLALSLDQSMLGQGLFALPGLTDPANYLAGLLVTAIAFLLLFTVVSVVLRLIFAALNSLFSLGLLGGVNRVLGMVLVFTKNLLIMILLVGIAYQPIYLAARMGLNWAGVVSGYMVNSSLAVLFMNAFIIIKTMVGITA